MSKKEYLVVILVMVVASITLVWRFRKIREQQALFTECADYADKVSGDVVLHGIKKSGIAENGEEYNIYFNRWIDESTKSVYELTVYVASSGSKQIEIKRYELDRDYDSVQLFFNLLFWNEVYNGTAIVVSEENFYDQFGDGRLKEYKKFYRQDGKPFTSRERDAGKGAGVKCETWKWSDSFLGGNDRVKTQLYLDTLKSLDNLINSEKK